MTVDGMQPASVRSHAEPSQTIATLPSQTTRRRDDPDPPNLDQLRAGGAAELARRLRTASVGDMDLLLMSIERALDELLEHIHDVWGRSGAAPASAAQAAPAARLDRAELQRAYAHRNHLWAMADCVGLTQRARLEGCSPEAARTRIKLDRLLDFRRQQASVADAQLRLVRADLAASQACEQPAEHFHPHRLEGELAAATRQLDGAIQALELSALARARDAAQERVLEIWAECPRQAWPDAGPEAVQAAQRNAMRELSIMDLANRVSLHYPLPEPDGEPEDAGARPVRSFDRGLLDQAVRASSRRDGFCAAASFIAELEARLPSPGSEREPRNAYRAARELHTALAAAQEAQWQAQYLLIPAGAEEQTALEADWEERRAAAPPGSAPEEMSAAVRTSVAIAAEKLREPPVSGIETLIQAAQDALSGEDLLDDNLHCVRLLVERLADALAPRPDEIRPDADSPVAVFAQRLAWFSPLAAEAPIAPALRRQEAVDRMLSGTAAWDFFVIR
jgi:hypothetical protein